MKQALLVLGMHRSGTSSVAGALVQLGAAAPATLMPEHPDNPKGYWESMPLVNASDRILDSAGSSWSDWRPFNPDWCKSVTGKAMSGELPDLIASEFGDHPLITFKDPRLCRLFPIWEQALKIGGYQPLVLTPLRSPIEVAASLAKRDGFSETRGLLLWLRHVLDAEAATRQTPRHFLFWSDFLHDWRAEISSASDRLGTSLPAWSDFTADSVDTFLDVRLRRAVHERAIPSSAPRWIPAAWDAMQTLHKDPTSSSAQGTLDDIRKEFDSTARIYGPALAGLEGERRSWSADLQDQLKSLKADLATARHERDTQMMARADTEALLHVYMAKVNDLEQQRDSDVLEATLNAQRQAEARISDLELRLVERDKADELAAVEIEALRRQAAEHKNTSLTAAALEQEKSALTAEMSEMNQRLSELQSACRDHVRTEEDLRSRLEASIARERHLDSELEARSIKKAELRQILDQERNSASEALAALQAQLQTIRDAEAARMARNPLRRLLPVKVQETV